MSVAEIEKLLLDYRTWLRRIAALEADKRAALEFHQHATEVLVRRERTIVEQEDRIAALEADKRRLVGHLNIISRGRGACEQQLCADAADMGLAAGMTVRPRE